MKPRNIVGFLMVLISCSCIQRNSKSNVQTQTMPNQHHDWNSGLRIENGPIQGLSYDNPLGMEYGHAYKTITIYNDSTVSIHLQMDLSKEYNFPAPHSNQKFKLVIWPQELRQNNVTFKDSLSEESRNFLQNGSDTNTSINISIAPQEKYVLTIGRPFEKPTNYYVSPNELFIQSDGNLPEDCKNFINQYKSTNASMPLGLRLDSPNVGVGCIIIACGQISYAEH